MQLTCRRCHGTFSVPDHAPTPCPACGSIEVVPMASARSPKAATTERPMPGSFSAPVSQPAAMPPSQFGAPAYGAGPMVRPSYPAPPPHAMVPTVPQGPPPQQQQAWGHQPYAGQAPTYPAYPQPVQVVIQNQINPGPYAPYGAGPYAMAPYVRRKDAGVATLLSFFLPGAGQLYNGQIGKGLGFMLVTLFINFPLMFVGVGFLTGLITWIWGMIDAHSSAERINRGEIVV